MSILNSRKTGTTAKTRRTAASAALLTLLVASQANAFTFAAHGLRGAHREVREQLVMLRKATRAFHSYDLARAAGWNAVISPCVSSPVGGMGFHVANMEALDANPFEIKLLQPEVLLYAPLPDGSMEFLGVEYIVPYTPENASTPPELFGLTFEYNPVQEIWALHVWTEKRNPLGIFAPFNPRVQCPAE